MPSKPSFQITLVREGHFHVNYTPGHNQHQCGMRDVSSVMNYRVRIVGDSAHLDSHGFLLDNNTVHLYFTNKYKDVGSFPSCENIAITAVQDILNMRNERHPLHKVLTAIDVMISGFPQAHLTASWRAPKRRQPNAERYTQQIELANKWR